MSDKKNIIEIEIEKEKNSVRNLDEAKLAMKILLVSSEMNGMDQDKNQSQGWSYIGYEAINAKLPFLMIKNKIGIIPALLSKKKSIVEDVKEFYDKYSKITKTKKQFITTYEVDMEFKIIDLETGFSITRKWSGEASDYGDKCLAKAITETAKRFKFNMFQITSRDIADSDKETVTRSEEYTNAGNKKEKDKEIQKDFLTEWIEKPLKEKNVSEYNKRVAALKTCLAEKGIRRLRDVNDKHSMLVKVMKERDEIENKEILEDAQKIDLLSKDEIDEINKSVSEELEDSGYKK